MKTKDVTPILKSLGWKAFTDEVGDKYALFELSDRIVSIIYGLSRLRDEQQLLVMRSTSTDAFSNACAKICPRDGTYTPLVIPWKNPHSRAPEISEEHVRQASDEAIAWAQEQDLDEALRDHAALPTNAPGARPVWHLAALALLGDVAKLKSYQASFEAGDRLGFVNYVTKDYIDRAVFLADDIVAGV